MHVIVVGRSGQVATALHTAAALSQAPVRLTAIGRPQIDLGKSFDLQGWLKSSGPDVVVNAAAFTNVDEAERSEDVANSLNAEGAGRLAYASAALGVPIIHLSTDYVFSGEAGRPYRENDALGPLSAYGRSKAKGEAAVSAAAYQSVILRLSWIFAPSGANFVRSILRLGRAIETVDVVSDQFGSPTFADDIAGAILNICRRVVSLQVDDQLWGVFHCASAGSVSRAEFADKIFACSRSRGGPSALVRHVPSSAYSTLAIRPKNCVLDCRKIQQVYGIKLPHWQDGLNRCMDEIARLEDW